MNDKILVSLIFAATCVACGDDAPADGGSADTGGIDTADDIGRPRADAGDDGTAIDSGSDIADAGDTIADAPSDAPDGSGADAAVDVADGSGEPDADVVEDTGPPPDAGTDCTDDPSVCELPYTCMGGVCRLSLSDRGYAERDFGIVEPEELTRLFTVLKGLAADVRFIALDMEVDPGSDEITTEGGSADLLNADTLPVTVRWQPLPRNTIVFRPNIEEGAELDGDTWISDPAFYIIDTILTIDFGTPQTVRAGFDIEQMSIKLQLNSASEEAIGEITGLVTRAEAESRVMIDAVDFPTFATLFCSDRSFEPDDGLWHMSDVLDCNGAPLDADIDGDGTNDAYGMIIAASFNAAVFLP
jgi:hypothetical protein